MDYLKKTLFGFIFLVFFGFFHYLFSPLLISYDWLFGVNTNGLILYLTLAGILILSVLSFLVFATLSQDFRLGLVFAFLGGIIPLAFNQQASGIFLAVGCLILLTIFYLVVEKKMQSYITFDPVFLLVGNIKNLTSLLAILISIGYYLSINAVIMEKGFALPDSLIPDALIEKLISQQSSTMTVPVRGDKYIAQTQITPEMIEYAKQHPELLQQYGVTPDQLEQLKTTTTATPATTTKPQNNSSITTPTAISPLPIATIKKMALEPINALVDQYKSFVAPILAFTLFSGLSFFFFLLHFLTPLVVKLIYYILEKTEFIGFEKEMREVKKLMV